MIEALENVSLSEKGVEMSMLVHAFDVLTA